MALERLERRPRPAEQQKLKERAHRGRQQGSGPAGPLAAAQGLALARVDGGPGGGLAGRVAVEGGATARAGTRVAGPQAVAADAGKVRGRSQGQHRLGEGVDGLTGAEGPRRVEAAALGAAVAAADLQRGRSRGRLHGDAGIDAVLEARVATRGESCDATSLLLDGLDCEAR